MEPVSADSLAVKKLASLIQLTLSGALGLRNWFVDNMLSVLQLTE
jgi:hypothetical protein